MSPKRKDRVAPPPGPDEWEVRFGTTEAAKGWDELCRHAAHNVHGPGRRCGPRRARRRHRGNTS
jgi:hypothetical protein